MKTHQKLLKKILLFLHLARLKPLVLQFKAETEAQLGSSLLPAKPRRPVGFRRLFIIEKYIYSVQTEEYMRAH